MAKHLFDLDYRSETHYVNYSMDERSVELTEAGKAEALRFAVECLHAEAKEVYGSNLAPGVLANLEKTTRDGMWCHESWGLCLLDVLKVHKFYTEGVEYIVDAENQKIVVLDRNTGARHCPCKPTCAVNRERLIINNHAQ